MCITCHGKNVHVKLVFCVHSFMYRGCLIELYIHVYKSHDNLAYYKNSICSEPYHLKDPVPRLPSNVVRLHHLNSPFHVCWISEISLFLSCQPLERHWWDECLFVHHICCIYSSLVTYVLPNICTCMYMYLCRLAPSLILLLNIYTCSSSTSPQTGQEVKHYGHKRAKLNPHSSTTNQQKVKNKSFVMMRQKKSIRVKGKRSFREKQVSMFCGRHTKD